MSSKMASFRFLCKVMSSPPESLTPLTKTTKSILIGRNFLPWWEP